MKTNTKIIIVILAVLFCSFFLKGDNTKPDESYKSVQTLSCKHPKYKNFTPRLKIDTVIDCSQLDPKLYIYRFKGITVDKKENIFVLANNCVLKFDYRGKLMEHFMLRRGEGPGEVRQYPQSIAGDGKGNIYLYDGYKLIKYNQRMEFVANISLRLSGRVFFDNAGCILGIRRQRTLGGAGRKALSKFTGSGKPIKTIVQFEDKNSRTYRNTIYGIIHAYSPNAYFAPLGDGIVYGHNMEYRLNKYDRDGNLTAIITLDENPVPIATEEKEKVAYPNDPKPVKPGTRKIVLKFPEHRPFFKNILTDEKNRIYVIRRQSVLAKEKDTSIDIFSQSGRYLYRVRLPFEPRLIKNGNLYYINIYPDSDGDDIYRVKKYRFQDYHLMKH